MSLVDELVQVCRKVYENKFVSAYDGNISVRNSSNSFLITRSGICKGEVFGELIIHNVLFPKHKTLSNLSLTKRETYCC